MTIELTYFSSNDLANRCTEEASKKDAKRRDDRFCYELVRRAFGLEDHDALEYVFNIYVKIWSKFWIRNAPAFESHPLTADDFISMAFFKVYNEIKGSRFNSFPFLNPFLAYLHTTLVRLVAEYLRKRNVRGRIDSSMTYEDISDQLERVSSVENLDEEAATKLLLQAIQERIDLLLLEEKDRILVECRMSGMSRAEIVSAYPDWWPDENAVRVAVQRIIHRKLYSDPILRDLFDELRGKKDK